MLRVLSRPAALALMLLPALALADDKDNDGFKPLFNGKDFSGWVTPEDKALFTIENGEIVGRTKGDLKKNEFLVTAQHYGDFTLKAKVKIRNGNSGIQFRSKRAKDGAVSGPQADVADGFWGLLYEERGRGILERYPEKEAATLVKKDDWNDFVITAKGDHVVIHFNGTKIIDRTDDKFDKTGIIALQTHVGPPMEVRFKDLMIKTQD
ncbi:MAG: hypothetical protein JWN86_1732 [Planctomycetota bacterium]|nr:hypothetical protein [Planctomycetota bacterium]